MNYRRLWPILAGSASLSLAGPEAAKACGGFFCTTAPMDQAGERILFAARDGVVTTHVQIQYSGEAADFAWVLPVPSPPEIRVSRDELFSQLDFATSPIFSLDLDGAYDRCGYQVEDFLGGCSTCAQTDGFPVEVVSRDRVGPYESVVITAEDAEAVVDWLTDNGYQLGDTGPELLSPTSGPPEIILRPTLVEEVGSTSGPARFTLLENYPNPFNSRTVIPFRTSIPEGKQVDATLRIFNVLGQPVRTVWKGKAGAGESQVHWDGLDETGTPVPSGTYLYQLDAGSIRMSRKLTVLS